MSDSQPAQETRTQDHRDGRQCRICLSGPEEEVELGRLIKPCKCKGSIRYVHVNCLNTWRKTGGSSESFWSCPQCGFKYNIARTKIIGLSTSPLVLGATTVVLFLLIVFAASALVSYFVPELDDPMMTVARPYDDDLGISWYTPLGVASDVIKETVHTFAEVSTPKEILEAQRLAALTNVEDTTVWGRFKRSLPLSFVLNEKKKRTKPVIKRRDPRSAYSPSEDGPRITIWTRLLRKFMLGLSLVGILSFLNLLLTMSLFGPLQIARTRWMRAGRREAGNARDLGTILIVIFVLIGVARALYGVYFGTRKLAQYVLTRAENAILEVHDEEDEDEDKKQEREEQDHQETRNPSSEPEERQDRQSSTATDTPMGNREARKRPGPIRIDAERLRRAQDEFGDELPDTPGGWREEWAFVD
ncbi:hypothetical protein FRB91_007983 [Serendipita sp. 411]|nr:hypothetical protein FRB91_007983 [Serendipita sp. 411]